MATDPSTEVSNQAITPVEGLPRKPSRKESNDPVETCLRWLGICLLAGAISGALSGPLMLGWYGDAQPTPGLVVFGLLLGIVVGMVYGLGAAFIEVLVTCFRAEL